MRCGFCHSGKVKSAEQYGVNRQQCDSCNTITKQAELKLTETQQKIINYLSNWKPVVVLESRDVTQDLDQDGIARAIGISRSNIPRIVNPLLDSNLVGQKKAHILDENNRTIGKMKRWVYYLTPAGKALVTESFSAENSRYYQKNDVKYERNIEGMICNCGNTSGWIVSAFDGQNPPEGCYNRVYDISCPSCHENMVTYQSKQSSKSPFKIVYGEYGSQITPAHGAETFEATRGEMRQRRRTPFYELPYEEESEDKDVNKYARNNAGSILWQATYQALLDEGRSHEQAETFCNTKFFDRFYEYLSEGLRQPMRNLFNNLRKPHLGLTRKQRRENRIANEMFEKYFPDMALEKYESHEGGHFMAEEPFICPECRRASTKSKTSQVCVRCESEYQAGRNAPMRVPWPGDEGYYAETFKAPTPLSPTRPSSDDFSKPSRPRRRRPRKEPKPGPEEPSF